jgi:hypothetical protein
VDNVLEENNVLSKKDAWKLIDEKIRIAEERKEHETSGSMENKGNKKSQPADIFLHLSGFYL